MLKDGIRVNVIPRGRRTVYYRWRDELTGAHGECSSGCKTRSDALVNVNDFIAQKISERRIGSTWPGFCERFEEEYLAKRREKTRKAWGTARRRFEAICSPVLLIDVNHSAISRFETELRKKLSPASVDSYLRMLKVALREAQRLYPEYTPPEIATEKHDAGGRPLTDEEFDAMVNIVESVVGAEHAPSWRELLRGLVNSGLRLGQAIRLSWELTEPIHVDMATKELVIRKAGHKGKREQRIRMVPDFMAVLNRRPERKGRVFRPMVEPKVFEEGGARHVSASLNTIGEKIALFGRKAGIVTGVRLQHTKEGTKEVPRYASAHDLKRTFARRQLDLGIPPDVVAKMCQHSTFDTTWHSYSGSASEMGIIIDEMYARRDKKKLPEKPEPKPEPRRDDDGPDVLPFERRA